MTDQQSEDARFDQVAHGYDPVQVDQHLAALREPGKAPAAAAALLERALRLGQEAATSARAQADQMLAGAQAEAERTVDQARDRAARLVQDAEAELARLGSQIQELDRLRTQAAQAATLLSDELRAASARAESADQVRSPGPAVPRR